MSKRSERDAPSPLEKVTLTSYHGRVLYSRGPIIRSLEILSAVAGLLAIAALVFALSSFEGRLDTIQAARQRSAFDTCRILDAVIVASGKSRERVTVYDLKGHVIGYVQFGGRASRNQVKAFIAALGLTNCSRFARSVRTGRRVPLRLPSHP